MNPLNRTSSRPVPGVRWGDYPELADNRAGGPTRAGGATWPFFTQRALLRRVSAVRRLLADWRNLGDPDFLSLQGSVRQRFVKDGLTPAALEAGCAFVAEATRRALGLAPYDCQLLAALAMLDNRLVEMATGEGKSLAAALAASVGALAGIPVHVLTANDYLVERDAEVFRPLFAFLGFGVASVPATLAPTARRAAYAEAIVYVTAKELAFDYLRDRLLHGASRTPLQRRASALTAVDAAQPLLRGLCMAIVDEADSILIDEAQMPLVLSRAADGAAQRALLWQAWTLSARLSADEHFALRPGDFKVDLKPAGRARIEHLATRLQPVWKNQLHREETIATALAARHVFARDRDYLVADGEVQIVDAVTGRSAPGRKWSRGLHALISLKEGCEAEPEIETLTQITFQRFFRRYVRFGGMSGTLAEASRELRRIYRVRIVAAPLQRPNCRERWPTRVFADDRARWDAALERIESLRRAGRPVLVGCDSVADSNALSQHLAVAGVAHATLNASFDQEEADIVARAGRAGQVTVATNMAGRGTDIRIDPAALVAGGLHVLCCQHNASCRHDRQLAGRAARQGQPGSCENWLSLQSQRFGHDGAARAVAALFRFFRRGPEVALPASLLALAHAASRWHDEAGQARRRRALLNHEDQLERGLAFCEARE